jgi:hypothetical protein
MLKKYAKLILFVAILIVTTYNTAPGGVAPGPCTPGGFPPCPASAPIDGGRLGILLAIGIGYAVSKLRNKE